jgi:hypothetical protein
VQRAIQACNNERRDKVSVTIASRTDSGKNKPTSEHRSVFCQTPEMDGDLTLIGAISRGDYSKVQLLTSF